MRALCLLLATLFTLGSLGATLVFLWALAGALGAMH